MNNNSLSGMSWVLGVVDRGSFGVLQVFDIAQHGLASDTNYWGNASSRAKTAANRAKAGWQNYFTMMNPEALLDVRLMKGDRCTDVVNK